LLEQPYRLALTTFRDSVRAFADGDYELARTLKLKDRELDALIDDVKERLVARGTLDSELVPSCVDLIFVARALERIGDHATLFVCKVLSAPITCCGVETAFVATRTE